MKKTTEELMEILKQKSPYMRILRKKSTNWNSRP